MANKKPAIRWLSERLDNIIVPVKEVLRRNVDFVIAPNILFDGQDAKIAFVLPRSAQVRFDLLNTLRESMNTISYSTLPEGKHTVFLETPLVPGSYLLRMSMDGQHMTKPLFVR